MDFEIGNTLDRSFNFVTNADLDFDFSNTLGELATDNTWKDVIVNVAPFPTSKAAQITNPDNFVDFTPETNTKILKRPVFQLDSFKEKYSSKQNVAIIDSEEGLTFTSFYKKIIARRDEIIEFLKAFFNKILATLKSIYFIQSVLFLQSAIFSQKFGGNRSLPVIY